MEYVDLAAQRTSGGPSRSGERCWKLLEAIEDLDICARALRGKAVRAPEAGEPADAGRQRLWAMRVTGPGVNDTGPEEGVGRLAHARLARISHSRNETSGRESKKCLWQRYLTDSWSGPDADTV